LNRAATQPLDVTEALRIAAACADVLSCAHRRGIPHGDVKPSNVFLEQGGGVKVLDFGSAHDIQPAPPRGALDADSVSAVATRTYASPEVLDGFPAEPRDDIFSLACVTYEMLAGRHPFGRLPASDARDRSVAAAPVAGVTSRQNAALARGLAWSRTERPASIEEWMNALLDRDDGSAADDTRPPSLAETAKRSARWGWTAVAAAAVLLALAAWYWGANDDRVAVTRVPDEPVAARSKEVLPRLAPPRRPQDATPASEPKPETVPVPPPPPASTAVAEASLPTVSLTGPPPRVPPGRLGRVRLAADSSSIRISEQAAAAVVLLRRIGEPAAPATVTWRLVDGSARAGEDFSSTAGASTRFQSGETTRTIYVPLVDDAVPELEEFFSLILASPTADLGESTRVVITIVDDD
jgi:serine/threonine protein kinase